MNFYQRAEMVKKRAEAMMMKPEHFSDEDRAWLSLPTTQALLARNQAAYISAKATESSKES